MKAIVKNIKFMWNLCGKAAECCVNAAKREVNEYKTGWAAAEVFWKLHPEARPVFPLYVCRY